ncbi:lamin tail domain-containing protein [Marinilabiliaceae bacterium JC017]|nr:lamin tail domain-containing protein [Marinilabiliaceae bacterium JC017]
MKRFFIFFYAVSQLCAAQVKESFDDGDFLNGPQWIGSTDRFSVNDQGQLQLTAPAETSDAYLFTRSEVVENATWEVSVELAFNPSSSNYLRIYLVADSPTIDNLSNAVYVEIGKSTDDICLHVKEDGKSTLLIDGLDDRVDVSHVNVRVKVTREGDVWSLMADVGNGWELEGSSTYPIGFTSQYFGIYCKYTATRSQKFFVDDISISGETFVDRDIPWLNSWELINGSHMSLVFSELLDQETVLPSAFSLIENSDCIISAVTVDTFEQSQVSLFLDPGLKDVEEEHLLISGLRDLSGNSITDTIISFEYRRNYLDFVCLVSAHQVDLIFSDTLDNSTVSQANLVLLPDNIRPVNLIASEDTLKVFFSEAIPEGHHNELRISNVYDWRGDTIVTNKVPLFYYLGHRHDLVFSEIMTDPSPVVGLPDSEFIELVNRSPFPLSLEGWILSVNDKHVVLNDYLVEPGDLVILFPSSKKELWENYHNALSVSSWPILTNEVCRIVFVTPTGEVSDALFYSAERFSELNFKDDGGWSMECVDRDNRSGLSDNWGYSVDFNGGTPGYVNSIVGENKDDVAPQVHHLSMLSDSTLKIFFTESVILDGITTDAITISSNEVGYNVAAIDSVFMTSLVISFEGVFKKNQIYSLKQLGLQDVAGNSLELSREFRFGASDTVETGDVVINEILFNPLSGGEDFIEVFNRSDKIIDLSDLRLAQCQQYGKIEKLFGITNQHRLLFPEDYFVFTPDSLLLMQDYRCENPHLILNVNPFPSLPDDEGCLALTNQAGQKIDSLCYSRDMHYALLNSAEGISLERVFVEYSSNDPQNWRTASADVGYATPTARNSQALASNNMQEDRFSLQSEVFTPNGDGMDDRLMLNYRNLEPEGMVTVSIYHPSGYEICRLADKQLMGTEGFFTWDGLGDAGQKAKPGIYIIYISTFYPSGKKEVTKLTCVVGVEKE